MLIISRPELLLILLLLIPAVYFRHFWKGRGGRIPFPLSPVTKKPGELHGGERVISILSSLLFWFALAAAIAAASGPKRISREEVFLNRGADILFVIDESPSMAAQDLQPGNRFTAAIELIRGFVEGRKNNHIGLVTFGKEAVLQMPPTKNYKVLLDRLGELQPGGLGDETAIGLGLGVACAHLQYSDAPRRIIILLTDGENNAGDITPLQAARIAAAVDTVVYTCGIGGEGETTVDYRDPETGERIVGSFSSNYDENLLREIANVTGGLFFPAPTEETLSEMFGIIDRIEMEDVRTGFIHKEDLLFRIFLIPGLISFLLSFFLRVAVLRGGSA